MTVTELSVEPVAPPVGASAPEPGKKFSKIIGPGDFGYRVQASLASASLRS
jgi:hypothetical protein